MEPTKLFVQKRQLHCVEEIFSHPPKGGQSTHMRLNYKKPLPMQKKVPYKPSLSQYGQTNVWFVGAVSREIFGHIGQNPSVSMSYWLHVVIFQIFFIKLKNP